MIDTLLPEDPTIKAICVGAPLHQLGEFLTPNYCGKIGEKVCRDDLNGSSGREVLGCIIYNAWNTQSTYKCYVVGTCLIAAELSFLWRS